MDRDGDADQRDGNQHPAQGVEIGHQWLDGRLRLGKNVLQHFDPCRADCSSTRRTPTAQGAAFGQDFTRGRLFRRVYPRGVERPV